jgi:Ca2+-binding RTX toxin-like protein
MTIDQVREAILSTDFGARIADSSNFLQQILRISDRAESLSGHRVTAAAAAAGPTPREQADIAAATLTGQELTAIAGTSAPEAVATVAVPTPEDNAAELAEGDDGRHSSLFLNGMAQTLMGSSGASPFAGRDLASNYFYLYSDDIGSGLIVDARNKTVLGGSIGDYPALGAGPDDALELDGDYSAGFALIAPTFVDQIVARAGNDYNLIADDDTVAAGATLTINAMPLKADNHMIFDGSAESDGRFVFFGSEAGDVFLGGAGDDRILGLGGADILSGGGGRDSFVYTGAAESSGPDFDILADFDPATDRIDLLGAVSGFGAAVTSGSLSQASFDNDLGAALGGLGASQAVWFAPDAGDLAGQIFLIVDANGIAGYQEGEDYVFAVSGAPLADLTGHTGFFI